MIAFAIFAIVGFGASLIVHLSTFLARPPLGMKQTVLLHVAIFLVGIPVMAAQPRGDEGPPQNSLREREQSAPPWMYGILSACFAYAMINFLVCMLMLTGSSARGSKASVRDGRYLITRSGVVIDEVTEAEYRLAHARGLRAFSGHWMFFYWLLAVGGTQVMRRRAAERARRPPPQLSRIAQTSSEYTLYPSPRLSPSAHSTLQWLLALAGLGALTAFVAVPLAHRAESIDRTGLICLPLMFVAFAVGFCLTARLFERLVPARCPRCNGRAFSNTFSLRGGQQNLPGVYTCHDCSHVHSVSRTT